MYCVSVITNRAYELYPSTLVKRLKDENRKRWDQEHRETMSALEQCMVDFDAKHGKDGGMCSACSTSVCMNPALCKVSAAHLQLYTRRVFPPLAICDFK